MSIDSPGRCVLIAEDEMLLAMMLEEALVSFGYRVFKAGRLPRALELAASESIDVAILDINLAGKEIFPVADELRRRGVPLIFTSGYGENGLPAAYSGAPMLQKPYELRVLMDALDRLLAAGVAT